MKLLTWIEDFIKGMLTLTFWFVVAPFLIICWGLTHRQEAWVYISNAIPLLLGVGWPGWLLLAFFTVLIASLFKKRAVFKVLWTVIGIGLVGYVVLIFICMK